MDTRPITQRRPGSGRVRPGLAALAVLIFTVACAGPGAERAAAPAATSGPTAPTAPTTSAPSAPAPTPVPTAVAVRIPYTAVSVVNAPLWVAKDGGDFEQEGVNAEIEYIATSTTVTQSMLSGEIALANSGLESLVTASLAGADLIGLASTTDRFIFRLYGAPGLSSLADLRGKRVAVTRLGTSTDTVARLLLQRAGLEPDRDVAIIQVGGVPEIFAAVQSGAAEGGVLSPPTIFRADAAGMVVLADTTETDIPFHQAVLMTTRRFVAANEETTRRVMRGYLRGVARFKQDKAFAKEVIGKYTRTEDDHVLEQTWAIQDRVLTRAPYLRAEALQLALDIAASQYPEARTRAPREFYEDRFLRELETNGFIASLYR